MNNMKCPFCQQELFYLAEDIYYCPNHTKHMGTKELWQELIHTRKENQDKQAVLNYIVDMLKILNQKYTLIMGKDVIKETVKLLERKESAFVHNKIEFPEFNDGLLEKFDKQFFENGQDDDLTETTLEQKDK